MTKTVSNADIEDVLSSIRRLVSADAGGADLADGRPAERAPARPAAEPPRERLILTPSLRVEAEPDEASDQPVPEAADPDDVARADEAARRAPDADDADHADEALRVERETGEDAEDDDDGLTDAERVALEAAERRDAEARAHARRARSAAPKREAPILLTQPSFAPDAATDEAGAEVSGREGSVEEEAGSDGTDDPLTANTDPETGTVSDAGTEADRDEAAGLAEIVQQEIAAVLGTSEPSAEAPSAAATEAETETPPPDAQIGAGRDDPDAVPADISDAETADPVSEADMTARVSAALNGQAQTQPSRGDEREARTQERADSLERKIAELEAMIGAAGGDWEPDRHDDGAEDDDAMPPFRRPSGPMLAWEDASSTEGLADIEPTPVFHRSQTPRPVEAPPPPPAAEIDAEMLRDMVGQMVREELQGPMGARITRNVRMLVRREIQRALLSQGLD